jgi:site-specific recombinase XerD
MEIGTLISNVQAELQQQKYAPSTRLSYARTLSGIKKWFQKNANGFYSTETHCQYLQYLDSCCKSNGVDTAWIKHKQRCIGWIGDCARNGTIEVSFERCGRKEFIPSSEASDFIATILASTSFSSDFSRKINSLLRKFFCFVENNGENVHNISRTVMVEYLQHCAENNTAEIAYVTRALRIVAEYFVSMGAMPSVPDFRFIVPKIRRKKIIPAFTENEIVAVLKAIDRNDPVGKRNFAIIFLAVSTGLRGGDIVNLKLTDIDYDAKIITIIQGKTQKSLITPISGQLCNIIADYVLNGRPQIANKHVFVRHHAPLIALHAGGVLFFA